MASERWMGQRGHVEAIKRDWGRVLGRPRGGARIGVSNFESEVVVRVFEWQGARRAMATALVALGVGAGRGTCGWQPGPVP
jgi:hypothetical protein